ncbi:MAG: helix-turn-helix domain-containing protein [Eubacterium sp.]|nr:helix-turn-helix domain-containing protein [Eubacterium sp.]
MKAQEACILPKVDKWSVFQALSNAYILHRIKNGEVEYSPLFCVRLRVNNYKHYSFNVFNEIDDTTFGGAVKRQRIEKHMTIKQVANIVGISIDTLMRIEQNKYDLYNADKLKKLCDILDLDAQKICSPYQLFLLNNQGEQILKFRKDNHLTQKQLAEMLGSDRQTVSRYENNIKPMPYELWSKYNELQNRKN